MESSLVATTRGGPLPDVGVHTSTKSSTWWTWGQKNKHSILYSRSNSWLGFVCLSYLNSYSIFMFLLLRHSFQKLRSRIYLPVLCLFLYIDLWDYLLYLFMSSFCISFVFIYPQKNTLQFPFSLHNPEGLTITTRTRLRNANEIFSILYQANACKNTSLTDIQK